MPWPEWLWDTSQLLCSTEAWSKHCRPSVPRSSHLSLTCMGHISWTLTGETTSSHRQRAADFRLQKATYLVLCQGMVDSSRATAHYFLDPILIGSLASLKWLYQTFIELRFYSSKLANLLLLSLSRSFCKAVLHLLHPWQDLWQLRHHCHVP